MKENNNKKQFGCVSAVSLLLFPVGMLVTHRDEVSLRAVLWDRGSQSVCEGPCVCVCVCVCVCLVAGKTCHHLYSEIEKMVFCDDSFMPRMWPWLLQ